MDFKFNEKEFAFTVALVIVATLAIFYPAILVWGVAEVIRLIREQA